MFRHENGLEKIQSVRKTGISWYPSRKQKVLAIDFGTSTLAVSYVTPTSRARGPLDIHLDEANPVAYIPTVLLIENDEIKIGQLALLSYTRLDHKNPLFFDRVKLELQNDQSVGRQSYIYGSDGKSYYLIEVIAIILSKVKQLLDYYFKTRGSEHDIEEFHWVLTVPALWGKRARNMMRGAACLAGLCSSGSNNIKLLPLRPTYTHYPPTTKELEITNPENLSLVYEPDAAAAWCRDLNTDRAQGPDAKPPLTTDDYFLTVDVGGGTIDVTGHQMLENGRMKRVQLPHGELYGGTTVNERFKIFLSDLVNDPNFSKYLSRKDLEENRAELMRLVYVTFETAKRYFTQETRDEFYRIEIPGSFYKAYKKELKSTPKADKPGVYYHKKGQQLKVSKQNMVKFFNASISKIEECIDRSIEDIRVKTTCTPPEKLKMIYLVGGFGGCSYISDRIRYKYGDHHRVIVPHSPSQSVARGACQYHEKKILEKADATYGIETCTEYDEANPVHVNGKKRKAANGKEFCENLFQPYIQIGDNLEEDQVYCGEFLPVEESQSTIGFDLYLTDQAYVNYTDGLTLIAKISIDCRKNQKVEFVLDFSGTEIQVFAYQESSGKRVKASVDFLSTLNKFENFS